ncbi:MAG: SCP2 sterol-binding domain-containing protein [Actinomycetota bacterium]|nr:SCP2 sterol-binding domain-containing protein [Actinomycetota bacterium]
MEDPGAEDRGMDAGVDAGSVDDEGVATTHPFLSDEWLEEARRIGEEYRGQVDAGPYLIRMNQIITEVPFADGTVHTHIDSSSGTMEMEIGHIEDPDVTVTLDYETARSIFIEGNREAGMQAFMAGRVVVQGDMTKLLLAMQQDQITPDPRATELHHRIQGITA